MLKITDEKYRQSALEDIAELEGKRISGIRTRKSPTDDRIPFVDYFAIEKNKGYIMEKFDLSKKEVEEYLHGSKNNR